MMFGIPAIALAIAHAARTRKKETKALMFPITMIVLVTIPVAGFFSVVWPYAEAAIDAFSQSLVGLGAFGVFVFGFLNRFLLPFGLHHVMNTYI
ncbi:hypothetical protein DT075_36415 [Bacillus licheniformis]|nr:hypothetical protein DT075_36415 [Bacillus licheniformis]